MRPQGQDHCGLRKETGTDPAEPPYVSGYTDNAPIGPVLRQQGVTSNQELSQKRAEAVMQYLISQGVRPDPSQRRGSVT
jgi:flagellar motor protein MotB